MKYLKILSLAAVAALAVMAIAGASVASAKICSTAGVGGSCGAGHGNEYTGTLHATLEAGTSATLTSGFINVGCTSSTLAGKLTNSSLATGEITALTFGSCPNNLGESCTMSTSGFPWHAQAFTLTAPNGQLVIKNVVYQFDCSTSGGTHHICNYKAAEVGNGATREIVIIGGEAATVKAEKMPLSLDTTKLNYFLCSSTAAWDGAYNVTTPSSLFLT